MLRYLHFFACEIAPYFAVSDICYTFVPQMVPRDKKGHKILSLLVPRDSRGTKLNSND